MEYAGSKGGRLCTVSELRKYLAEQGGCLFDEDMWVAAVTDTGDRCWVQVGWRDHGRQTGRTHTESGFGYPGWAEQDGPLACRAAVAYMAGDTGPPDDEKADS